MTTAVLSIVAVSEPDPVEYVDIECQPAAISVDCNNVQMMPLKLKALHRSGLMRPCWMYSGGCMSSRPARTRYGGFPRCIVRMGILPSV